MVVQLTRWVRLFASCTEGGHPSSENDRLLPPPSLAFAVRGYVRVHEHVSSQLFLLAVAGARAAGLPLASAPLLSRALERALPPLVVRVPRLLFLPEFFLLSTVRAPDYSRPPSTVFARRLGRRRIVSRERYFGRLSYRGTIAPNVLIFLLLI